MDWRYTIDRLADVVGAPSPATGATAFGRASTDTRHLEPGDVFFALKGERFDGNRFVGEAFARGAAAAVTTEGHDAGPCLVVEDPLEALQQFAAFHRAQYDIPVIAITGSCGKTTAKDLIAAVLGTRYTVAKTPGNLNNDIGCPLSLLEIGGKTDVAVIEMGANHAGEVAALCRLAQPTEAAITMVAPAHLEGFGTVENVASAKAEIVEALGPNGVFYVNADDPWCCDIAQRFSGEQVRFGSSGEVVLEACAFTGPGEMRLDVAPVGELRLPLACRAHAVNVLLAVAVGLRHNVQEFQDPLRKACANSTRFKIVTIGPLVVIDDTYNANPASMAAAFEALAEWPASGARIAALGEMLELGDAAPALHRDVGERAAQLGVTHLFVTGPHARDVAAAAEGVQAEVMDDPQAIAQAVYRLARPGDMLLVKGSRGMRMEWVIEALRERYA